MASNKKAPLKISVNTSPAENDAFVLDDGTREITLKNKYGKVLGVLRFKAVDIAMFERYSTLRKDFEDLVKQVSAMDIGASGDADHEEDWAKLKQLEDALRGKLNKFLDVEEEDSFGEIFNNCNPFSSIGGRFFVEQVLDVIGKVVQSGFQAEAELSKARVEKYLKGAANAGATAGNA